ncbi:MAG: mechanosensitive ion channel family protein [Psychromonas sp.]
MSMIASITETISDFIPLIITLAIVALVLAVAHRLVIKKYADIGNERMFTRQLFMLSLSLVGVIAVALALPVGESSRNQIIGLIGLLISGVLALSSTNIFANLAAGILLRVTKPFVIGDFVTVGDNFGRISARGLFDTELQSQSGELVAIPNTYLISSPVKTIPSELTLVSATLSLGYDVHHQKVEPLLIDAAKQSGLEGGFVHILELGNFAVTYRVSGVLTETDKLVSARSDLYKSILDTLHNNNIEIVSPSFMNQRPLAPKEAVIPESVAQQVVTETETEAEKILFAKAQQAGQIEKEKQQLKDEIAALDLNKKVATGTEKKVNKEMLARTKESLEKLEEAADAKE